MAVLETARGGIVLRGVGYESNEASVLTNVSSDHLDLQGIHTLPELAEVKATICRMTRPDGWAVLNADDPLVRRGRAAGPGPGRAVLASTTTACRRPSGATLPRGGRAYSSGAAALVEVEDGRATPIVAVADGPDRDRRPRPAQRGQRARGRRRGPGARARRSTQVADGLRDFRPDVDRSPGRLNLFRLGGQDRDRRLRPQRGRARRRSSTWPRGSPAGAAGRAAPITAIIGTAGDRPDDTLRGIGRIAAQRAQRVAIKETPQYLRGRTRESVVGELLAGVVAGGRSRRGASPVYPSETAALRAELTARSAADGPRIPPDAARVIVLMCHEERDEVFALLRAGPTVAWPRLPSC